MKNAKSQGLENRCKTVFIDGKDWGIDEYIKANPKMKRGEAKTIWLRHLKKKLLPTMRG